MQDYLSSAPVIRTTSLDEARDAVTRVYLPHRLEGRREAMDMRLNAVSSRTLTVGFLTYGAETELTMPPTQTCYHVNLTVSGTTQARRGATAEARTSAGTSGTVLLPNEQTTVAWAADAEQLILKVPRAQLESHLADLLGRPVAEVVNFDFELDLVNGAGPGLLRAVRLLATELDQPDGPAYSPLARRGLESYVLTELLLAGRHQFTDALAGEGDRSQLGRLAPVVRYVEDHADTELTPELLARVGHVSVRTLHAAFRERLGESPMAFVRRVRLSRVRDELLAGDPTTARVTDIATRWGFYHQSRFAQQYRSQFRELPSVTLHR